MSSTSDIDQDAAPGERSHNHQERSWRTRRGFLAAGSIGILVATGAVVVVTSNGDDRTSSTSTLHQGMVDGTVWVANEGGGSLTAIDAATNEVETTVVGVEGPHNVQVSPDGASVWTVSGHDGYAVMLASESMDVHGVAQTGAAPAHVVISPDGATAYTTNGQTTPSPS